MPSTEQLGVEQLLMRAYHDRQVHRLGAARDDRCSRLLSKLIGLSALSTGGGSWAGEVVDTSCLPPGAPLGQTPCSKACSSHPTSCSRCTTMCSLSQFYVELGVEADFIVWDKDSAVGMGHRVDIKPDSA